MMDGEGCPKTSVLDGQPGVTNILKPGGVDRRRYNTDILTTYAYRPFCHVKLDRDALKLRMSGAAAGCNQQFVVLLWPAPAADP